MRYSIKPRDRIYVKGYGFLSFAENMGKNLSNKYGQKLLNSTEKSTTDAINTASKRAILKAAGATCDLIGNKIADKIASVSKKSTKELQNNETEVDVERATPKKRYISPEERQQILIFHYYNNIIMEYQKIADLLDSASNKPSRVELEREIGLK